VLQEKNVPQSERFFDSHCKGDADESVHDQSIDSGAAPKKNRWNFATDGCLTVSR
jgi:hypothetical protein